MVDRITYEGKDPGEFWTSDEANELKTVINGLGTAADLNAGTLTGNVPVLDAGGKIPAGLLPEVFVSGSDGDVVGPNSTSSDLPALFDGTTGKLLKAGTAAQLVPSGTTLNFLQMVGTTPTFVATSAIITALEGAAGLSYTAIDDLDASGAADDIATGLITNVIGTAGEFTDLTLDTHVPVIRDGTDRGVIQLGTAAIEDTVAEVPATAADLITGTSTTQPIYPATLADVATPTATSTASGTVTVAFADTLYRTTTLAGNVTTLTVTGLTDHVIGRWLVTTGGTGYSITFPSTTFSTLDGDSSLAVASNRRVLISFMVVGSQTLVFWSGALAAVP